MFVHREHSYNGISVFESSKTGMPQKGLKRGMRVRGGILFPIYLWGREDSNAEFFCKETVRFQPAAWSIDFQNHRGIFWQETPPVCDQETAQRNQFSVQISQWCMILKRAVFQNVHLMKMESVDRQIGSIEVIADVVRC